MALKIIGGMEVESSISAEGKPLVSSVGDSTGTPDNIIEVDTYSLDELNEFFSVIPLSKYGTNDYLPAGVAGSFEGASASISYRRRNIILEDNGDLVMLRNGTNGSTRSVFYSYLSNALDTTNMHGFINTNKRYNPHFFGNNHNAIFTLNTDSTIILGQCERISDKTYHYFISETNNTMDDTVHNGIIIPTSSFEGDVQFATIDNNTAYIFCMSYNNFIKMKVYTIPRSSISNNTQNVVPTLLTGWTTTSFYGDSFVGDDIIMSNNLISTDPASKPYMLVPDGLVGSFVIGGGGLGVYVAKNNVSGEFRIRVDGDAWATSQTSSVRPAHAFSYVLNINAKTAKLDEGNIAPLTIINNGGSLSVSGSLLYDPPISFANTAYSYLFTPTGTNYVYAVGNTANAAQYIIKFKQIGNPSSIFDALDVRRHKSSTDVFAGRWGASYASFIGSANIGVEILPDNNCRLNSTDPNSNYINVRAKYSPPSTYIYKSVSMGTIEGFAPNINRSQIGYENRIFISYIGQDNSVTTSMSILTEYRLTGNISVGADGLPLNNTTVSIDSSLLNNFKNSMLAGEQYNHSAIVLYIPQQPQIPVFAVIEYVNSSRQSLFKVVEVSVNRRSGAITIINLVSVMYQSSAPEMFSNITSLDGASNTSFGITIYEGSDFYFVGGNVPVTTSFIGNASSAQFRGRVMKNTGKFNHFSISNPWYGYTTTNDQISAFPGLGFGIFNGTLQEGDDYTKMIFTTYGTTSADYDEWKKKDSIPNKVIVSQDMPDDFMVYFTQDTPVLIGGKTFILPITNINLKSIKPNPASSIFHVYVVLVEGIAKYKITEMPMAESGATAHNILWIGTVTTNNLQISEINVNKRARLDIFGAAFDPTGSSFPVSFGLPSQTGTINW